MGACLEMITGMHKHNRLVVSILVADRPGIMRDITSAIADMGANIDGISQTVVEGYFTVILTATFQEKVSPESVKHAIAENFRAHEADITVRPFVPVPVPRDIAEGEPYVLTITGRDRPGILKRATTFLAEKSINIEDWECFFSGPEVSYVGEVTMPAGLEITEIRNELQAALLDMGMKSSMQHRNIFRATNEIGPMKSLLREADGA
jgi:glycine cleavage system transcriptional repressor